MTDERPSQKQLAASLAASTERFRKHNDATETPMAKAARERRERLTETRNLLKAVGRDRWVDGTPMLAPYVADILRIILDELEAR